MPDITIQGGSVSSHSGSFVLGKTPKTVQRKPQTLSIVMCFFYLFGFYELASEITPSSTLQVLVELCIGMEGEVRLEEWKVSFLPPFLLRFVAARGSSQVFPQSKVLLYHGQIAQDSCRLATSGKHRCETYASHAPKTCSGSWIGVWVIIAWTDQINLIMSACVQQLTHHMAVSSQS